MESSRVRSVSPSRGCAARAFQQPVRGGRALLCRSDFSRLRNAGWPYVDRALTQAGTIAPAHDRSIAEFVDLNGEKSPFIPGNDDDHCRDGRRCVPVDRVDYVVGVVRPQMFLRNARDIPLGATLPNANDEHTAVTQVRHRQGSADDLELQHVPWRRLLELHTLRLDAGIERRDHAVVQRLMAWHV